MHKKGSIFMTNFLYSSKTKSYSQSQSMAPSKITISDMKVEIARNITKSCTVPLLISLLKMNHDLTISILHGITTSNMNKED